MARVSPRADIKRGIGRRRHGDPGEQPSPHVSPGLVRKGTWCRVSALNPRGRVWQSTGRGTDARSGPGRSRLKHLGHLQATIDDSGSRISCRRSIIRAPPCPVGARGAAPVDSQSRRAPSSAPWSRPHATVGMPTIDIGLAEVLHSATGAGSAPSVHLRGGRLRMSKLVYARHTTAPFSAADRGRSAPISR